MKKGKKTEKSFYNKKKPERRKKNVLGIKGKKFKLNEVFHFLFVRFLLIYYFNQDI